MDVNVYVQALSFQIQNKVQTLKDYTAWHTFEEYTINRNNKYVKFFSSLSPLRFILPCLIWKPRTRIHGAEFGLRQLAFCALCGKNQSSPCRQPSVCLRNYHLEASDKRTHVSNKRRGSQGFISSLCKQAKINMKAKHKVLCSSGHCSYESVS